MEEEDLQAVKVCIVFTSRISVCLSACVCVTVFVNVCKSGCMCGIYAHSNRCCKNICGEAQYWAKARQHGHPK